MFTDLPASALITPRSQACASNFCKHVPQGMLFLPLLAQFGREHYQMFNPTPEQIACAPLIDMYGERPGLLAWGEDEGLGIKCQVTRCMDRFGVQPFGTCLKLTDQDLTYGIVNPGSKGDHWFKWKGYLLGSFENKGAGGSILAAMAQAAATGSNMAMALLRKGVPIESIIIPVVANTGITMLFGVVTLLHPSSPAFTPVSKILDLCAPKERREAAARLQLIKEYVKVLSELVSTCLRPEPPPSVMTLGSGRVFVKPISLAAFEKGLGLFANEESNPCDIGPGMMHMIEVLNLLHAHEIARKHVVFPLSFSTPTSDVPFYQIVYPHLGPEGYLGLEGYRIGCPIRQPDQEQQVLNLFELYREALCEAVAAVHDAGVIHCDLYLSNVMWRQEEGGAISIKLIDWDASHRIEEGKFCPRAENRLEERFGVSPHFGVEFDLEYLLVLEREYNQDEQNLWMDLGSTSKDIVDTAFYELFRLCQTE
jgi:hypothetical protein